MKSVLVLGGYGNFGRRIVAALAREPDCRVFVCGRNAEKAALAAREAGGSAAPLAVDCHGRDFSGVLRRLGATLVIHTAGPFHGQRYTVPRACIAAGAHYLDLADARGYVCGIGVLDAEARESDVLITSGTSSLPALSSAVVDALRGQFSAIDSIDHGITSGAKPPGRATMQGALGYAGKPFLQWCEGNWRSVHGWQGITRRRYPSPVGARWLADCDVPDLELFPRRYAPLRSVRFRAGVSPAASMFAVWLGAGLVRSRLLPTLASCTPVLHGAARRLARFGPDCSAMHVTVHGVGVDGGPLVCNWSLVAHRDHGPFIPSFPAVALARKIVRDDIAARGAMPCMGLVTLEEILNIGSDLDLQVRCDATR
jgi:saccharopine dehydrogenase-like NADP-dependent oxidoreductase